MSVRLYLAKLTTMEVVTMCHDAAGPLSLESMLRDPLIRLVMASDRVSIEDFIATMQTARAATRPAEELPGVCGRGRSLEKMAASA